MNKFTVLLLILLALLTNSIQAQEDFDPIRLSIRTSFGYSVAISPLEKGYITDNLITFDKQTFYAQFISANYYFNKNLGIDLTLSVNNNDRFYRLADRFDQEVNQLYRADYFVLPDNYNPSSGNMNFFRVYTGPTYKIEVNKVVFIGRLLLGLVSIGTNDETVFLKERNSNEYFKLDFETQYDSNDSFIVNPSFSVGYRIYRRIMLSADINYSVYKPNLDFTFRTTRMTTGEVTTSTLRYDNVVQELSFGVGVHVILWQKK